MQCLCGWFYDDSQKSAYNMRAYNTLSLTLYDFLERMNGYETSLCLLGTAGTKNLLVSPVDLLSKITVRKTLIPPSSLA